MFLKTRSVLWLLLLAGLVVAAGQRPVVTAQTGPVVSLDPLTTYQTMTGWQASNQSGQIACAGFDQYRDQLFDMAINDLGINRVTVSVRAGSENPDDLYAQVRSGQISNDEYRARWYEPINDNDDPFVMAEGRFHFSELDDSIELVVEPLRQRAQARGEALVVVLLYIDFAQTDFEHRDAPEEYAELVAAAFQHLHDKYGWTPDLMEVVLEPDNKGQWSGAQIGQAMVAAGRRLASQGFQPGFIAPSTLNMGHAVSWFDEMIQVPGVLDYLTELSYHRYGGVSTANLQAIGERAARYGVYTGMLEHIGSDYADLHQDLKIANNSAWQQFTLAFCATSDNGGHYYRVEYAADGTPTLVTASRTWYLRQYFKYIRAGAQRIGAQASDPGLDPLAFINPDGRYVVVVKAERGAAFALEGLPPGNYEISYTTAREPGSVVGVLAVGAAQLLAASIPEAGVITIAALTTPATPLPSQTVTATTRPADTATAPNPATATHGPADTATAPDPATATTQPTATATAPASPTATAGLPPVDIPAGLSNQQVLAILLGCTALVGILAGMSAILAAARRKPR